MNGIIGALIVTLFFAGISAALGLLPAIAAMYAIITGTL